MTLITDILNRQRSDRTGLMLEFTLKFKLPTVSFFKPIAKVGGLMTYGANQETYFPRCIVMANEILNGAKPSDMLVLPEPLEPIRCQGPRGIAMAQLGDLVRARLSCKERRAPSVRTAC
jgi:hypothetical protein